MLTGVVNCICGIGLDEDAAMDAEEYLVDKYSLSSKHPNGLNMIPGGREGIRVLRKLSPGGRSLTESDDREAFLDGYLKTHSHFGKPNPGVAESWNDPAYAEAVICGRENRLSADQVREIRYLAATGNSIQRIKDIIAHWTTGRFRVYWWAGHIPESNERINRSVSIYTGSAAQIVENQAGTPAGNRTTRVLYSRLKSI